ncbi:MAG: GNAT family N-acetyltransferase [Bdellovibrionota bacterium]
MEKAVLITFAGKYREEFKELNLAWIKKYFRAEQKDLDQVNNPEDCLRGGGEIFFVIDEGKAVGTCALYKNGEHSFELAKMAVEPGHQGRGFGDLLMEVAENWAKARGAKEILILSNTILEPAIALYRKHGYETTHLGPHPDYERCNIEMKKKLSAS